MATNLGGRMLLAFGIMIELLGAAATVPPRTDDWACYSLKADQTVQLNLPHGREFGASGLLLTPAGDLLTVSDRGASLYRIQLLADTNAADLVLVPDCFTDAQLAPFSRQKTGYYDCEGIAQDNQGRLYVCEEADRWILRWDPATRKVERLNIDWAPVKQYFSSDRNASFEGIAIGNGKLFVANERELGQIIVLDLASLKILDHFSVHPHDRPARDVHYSDLCWFDGALFALLRESSVVLKIDPDRRRVLAEYDFSEMERAPGVIYWTRYPTSTMEGLAVNRDFIWLATDNNGLGRMRYPKDLRPTLFRCRRPDAIPK